MWTDKKGRLRETPAEMLASSKQLKLEMQISASARDLDPNTYIQSLADFAKSLPVDKDYERPINEYLESMEMYKEDLTLCETDEEKKFILGCIEQLKTVCPKVLRV